MTFEQMKEIAEKVATALNLSPDFSEAELLKEDLTPGDPLPVSFVDRDGNELVVALDVL